MPQPTTDFRNAVLVTFCRQNGLQTTGSKTEIAERIAAYIQSGTKPSILVGRKKQTAASDPIPANLSRTTVIGSGWQCTEQLRAFFIKEVGPQFHFNQLMRDFVKNGSGKTLQDGIDVWQADKSGPKVEKEIAPQFEYNRHIREYYTAHPHATREAAIAAWREIRAQRKGESE